MIKRKWKWALYHFIWMPLNSQQKENKKNMFECNPSQNEKPSNSHSSYQREEKTAQNEHGLLQHASHPVKAKRWKFMMLINLSICVRAGVRVYILQSPKNRRLEMRTANNRQQYPGFTCLLSDTIISIYRLSTFTRWQWAAWHPYQWLNQKKKKSQRELALSLVELILCLRTDYGEINSVKWIVLWNSEMYKSLALL